MKVANRKSAVVVGLDVKHHHPQTSNKAEPQNPLRDLPQGGLPLSQEHPHNLRVIQCLRIAFEMGSLTPLPYWQTNIPISQRESACPTFLQNLSEKDISILSTPDSSYQTFSWPSVQRIVTLNRLDLFQRLPSNLRLYLQYIHTIKRTHGSVMHFMLEERLHWTMPITADGVLFEKETDWKVLKNDWPYGIDERIVHLVVWTKFELEDDPATDDLTAEARKAVQRFVDGTFGKRVGKENVSF